MIQENHNFDSTSLKLSLHVNSFCNYILLLKYAAIFSIIILDPVTLGFPVLFGLDNKPLRPSKRPRLKLNSQCFSANPFSPIW